MDLKEKIMKVQTEIQGIKQQLNLLEQSKLEIITQLLKKQGVLEYLETESKTHEIILSGDE